MQTTRLISALAGAALLFGTAPTSVATAQTPPPVQTAAPMTTPTKAPADMMTPAAGATMRATTPGVLGTLAFDARSLRARRTPAGYALTGQAQVSDPCYAARFDPSLLTIYPPQFNLMQFRRPDRMGMMCIQQVVWVTVHPRTVASAKPPAYVTVRTRTGVTRVPIR